MKLQELRNYYEKFKYGEDNFHNLMQFRVKEILLISTFYDAYIFEHDSLLSEQIVGEYHQLNLTTVPRITSTPSGEDALELLKIRHFDLVITTMRTGEENTFELSRKIKDIDPQVPIILMLTVKSDIAILNRNRDRMGFIEKAFLWNGDSKLILAMIKHIEDSRNAPYDTEHGMVKVILLVEDSVNFISIYLPLLYTEIMEQTQRLISEELNDNQKYNRMRTRPKVLVAESFEDACTMFHTYREHMLCVMSDMEFYRNGMLDGDAGIRMLKSIRKLEPDLACILQSSLPENRTKAEQLGVTFFHKQSQFLLNDLRNFIIDNLGFGNFVFRTPDGTEIARARNIGDFERVIPAVPMSSILFHTRRKDFSTWLIAHGEMQYAKALRPVEAEDFDKLDDYRSFLVEQFRNIRRSRNRGKILSLNSESIGQEGVITSIGSGSLGGKGRGLAFFNAFLVTTEFERRFGKALVRIPHTTIIGTSVFIEFVRSNNLVGLRECSSDEEIKKRCIEADLPAYAVEKLRTYLNTVKCPIAVRSSGLLEDSQSQPFAGVYQTYMLPNNSENPEDRLEMLLTAVKLVFSSVFLNATRQYIENLNYILEEERMAVVLQEVVGSRRRDYYYPHISGVAQSYNYYPTGDMENTDGVASIAVGLGQSVVDGERNYRFCPAHPTALYLSDDEIVRNTQTEFYAVDLGSGDRSLEGGEFVTLSRLRMSEAEKDGVLTHLASVWDKDNQRLIDGIENPGPRVVNFSNILKYEVFPLSRIIKELLDIAQIALGVPVEIEFAVSLDESGNTGNSPVFYLLQVRPMTVGFEDALLDTGKLDKSDLLLYTEEGLGNGKIEDIRDIVYIDPDTFDNTKTLEMQKEIEALNSEMKALGREYILLGPGRWGSRDQFLGIPVYWAQISKAKIIVEVGLENFDIEPSQGTHFFHNVVAMSIGYFNVPHKKKKKSFIDWEYIKSKKSTKRGLYLRHIVNETPFKVVMDGKKRVSVVYK